MIPKKSSKASLENKRSINFIIGLIVSLSLILISFEWTHSVDIEGDLKQAGEIDITDFIIEVIPREEPRPPVEAKLPPVKQVIDIVSDDVELEAFVIELEADLGTSYIFPEYPDEEEVIEEDVIHYYVKDMPKFNGGNPNQEFARYIARNLRYPELPAEMGVSGRVIIQFDIDARGNLVNPLIIRSIDPALDAEALRVVSASPKWTPGKMGITAVKVRFVFPISFVLN